MANVNINFNGKDYLLSCDNGQEEHLIELAEYLNKKFKELKSELGNIGESKLLLISSIKIIDDLPLASLKHVSRLFFSNGDLLTVCSIRN